MDFKARPYPTRIMFLDDSDAALFTAGENTSLRMIQGYEERPGFIELRASEENIAEVSVEFSNNLAAGTEFSIITSVTRNSDELPVYIQVLQQDDTTGEWKVLCSVSYRTPENFELTGVSINSTPIKVLYKTGNPFIIKHFTVGATEFMTFDEIQGSHVYMDCNQDQDFSEEYRFGFNGQEKVNEVVGIGNHNTALFWEYDTRLGRRWNLDPVINSSLSLYSTFEGNPIWESDVLGDDPSTHTDREGNIKAVYNDNDMGVYLHEKLPARYAKQDGDVDKNGKLLSKLTGGKNIGETEYWDEFADLKTKSPVGSLVLDGRKNASWDYIVEWMHNDAMNYELPDIANMSKLHQKYDLKNNADWAGTGPQHEMTGRMLNGKWATARSAGNFLAGWNGATGKFLGQHISGTTYLKMAGALNLGQWNKINAFKILINLESFGKPPYYGEDEYSGRRIIEGINFGGIKKQK